MTDLYPQGIRVGGSALPDGVLMLTPMAAAIAREKPDGGFSVTSFALPERKPHPVEKVPFLRILPKLIGQMGLVVRGWKPGKGRKPPVWLIGALVVLSVASLGLNVVMAGLSPFWHATGSSVLQLGLFFALIGATRAFPRVGRIWRFHGGEHQAIAAYEAGMDLTPDNASTRSLYHPRCGTNLATLSIVLMVPGMIAGSLITGFLGYLVTIAVPLPSLCVAFEIVMLGQTRIPSVLWPGLAFQRLTVARPGERESEAGILALKAALVEHVKVQAERDAASQGVVIPARAVAQIGAHAAE
ncbi:MAG TPA: DUF1385 domain-containing protein [Chloroflexota bacterium]